MRTFAVDDRQRIRLPQAKAGEVFACEPGADGTIKLIPIAPQPDPERLVAKLAKKDGIPIGYTLGPDAIGRAVAEERESRS